MELSEIKKELDVVVRRATMATGSDCEIELVDGEILLTGNHAALLHIANRIIGLALTGVKGSHFTIDKADIAPKAEIAITIGLAKGIAQFDDA